MQADDQSRAARNWIIFIDIPKCFDDGQKKVTFVNVNGRVKIYQEILSLWHNQINCDQYTSTPKEQLHGNLNGKLHVSYFVK